MYHSIHSEAVHEWAKDVYEIGLLSVEKMRRYDLSCLTNMTGGEPFSARELKRIRTGCKLSQIEFASRLQVSPGSVQKWETDKAKPRGAVLMLLDMAANQCIRLNIPCCRDHWQSKACSSDNRRRSAYLKLHGQEPPCCDKHRLKPNLARASKFDAVCLPPVRELKPSEITDIRIRNQTNVFLFSCCMNVDETTVRRWENGHRKPRGPALRLLNLIDEQGIDFLIAHKNPTAPSNLLH